MQMCEKKKNQKKRELRNKRERRERYGSTSREVELHRLSCKDQARLPGSGSSPSPPSSLFQRLAKLTPSCWPKFMFGSCGCMYSMRGEASRMHIPQVVPQKASPMFARSHHASVDRTAKSTEVFDSRNTSASHGRLVYWWKGARWSAGCHLAIVL